MLPARRLARGGERLARDAQVGDHRAALLRQAGLVEARHVQAVDQRRHAEHLVDGHDAGAADAHHPHAEVGVVRRAGAARAARRRARGSLVLRLLAGHDGEEGGAVALEAREVLVAGGLVDLRLAAELGLDRHAPTGSWTSAPQSPQPSHTRSLIQTRSLRLGGLAALALAAQLGRALLVVDQHGHALDLAPAPAGRRAAPRGRAPRRSAASSTPR